MAKTVLIVDDNAFVRQALELQQSGWPKSLNFLEPRLMHSCATVVIPLYDCVVFVSTLNGAELVRWFSEITQPLDAITGSQFRLGIGGPIERWILGAI